MMHRAIPRIVCATAWLVLWTTWCHGQDNLGNQQYVVVKDYKPVLAESYKISDLPAQDTTPSNPPALTYETPSLKLPTQYESGLIKPVTVKDENIQKLYRSLLKLGAGTQSTYNGELYVNSLRSKDYSAGLHLGHFSGKPSLDHAGITNFSNNTASLYGRYFTDGLTLNGEVRYDREVCHYYGFDPDTLIADASTYRQVFNTTALQLGFERKKGSTEKLLYAGNVRYSLLTDAFDKKEGDFLLDGWLSKVYGDKTARIGISLDYFKKTEATYQSAWQQYHNIGRHIIGIDPSLTTRLGSGRLRLGLRLNMEKNLETEFHVYPDIELELPVVENVLTAFGGFTGRTIKNSYATVTAENPFFDPQATPMANTSVNLEIKAGLKGSVKEGFRFAAWFSHASVDSMLLFVNNTLDPFPATFGYVSDDMKVTTLHAEAGYQSGGKLNLTLRFDQRNYRTGYQLKAWHKPASELALDIRYNLRDKILAGLTLFAMGPQYARLDSGGSGYASAVKLNGYADVNLSLEYRYTKILSVFLNLNNLGFSRYYRWNQYPSERMNVLGGIKYAL